MMHGRTAGVLDEGVLRETNSELGETLVAEQQWLTRYVARRLSADLRTAFCTEDVVQETFVAALRHGREFRGAGEGSLRRWLAALANNRLCDLARGRRRLKRGGVAADRQNDGEEPAAGVECSPDERLHGTEERTRLAVAVGALREEYREVIRLRYFCGLDVEEVALRLGKSPGAVAMLCHRAVKRLRRALSYASFP